MLLWTVHFEWFWAMRTLVTFVKFELLCWIKMFKCSICVHFIPFVTGIQPQICECCWSVWSWCHSFIPYCADIFIRKEKLYICNSATCSFFQEYYYIADWGSNAHTIRNPRMVDLGIGVGLVMYTNWEGWCFFIANLASFFFFCGKFGLKWRDIFCSSKIELPLRKCIGLLPWCCPSCSFCFSFSVFAFLLFWLLNVWEESEVIPISCLSTVYKCYLQLFVVTEPSS